ncbi:MAG: DUF2924 domain-containing protein [Deltaproteobacteria bacterium]|nr:DUF2924 domain-containing protein [Deltaproteobacteria bacterium]
MRSEVCLPPWFPDHGTEKDGGDCSVTRHREHELLLRLCGILENILTRLSTIEDIQKQQTRIMLLSTNFKRTERNNPACGENDKGLPYGTELYGPGKERTYKCTVVPGGYKVNDIVYPNLSAAATAAVGDGARRTGTVFWRLGDGRMVRDVYPGQYNRT